MRLQAQGESAVTPFYPSKRDRWLEVVIWMASLLSVAAGLGSLVTGAGLRILALTSAVCLGVPGFMVWSFYGTGYTLFPDELRIRSGPFRFRVPLGGITSVVPSRNPVSSPACSLDRLEIRYREGRSRILISPENRPAFLEALAERCKQLVHCGDRLLLQRRV